MIREVSFAVDKGLGRDIDIEIFDAFGADDVEHFITRFLCLGEITHNSSCPCLSLIQTCDVFVVFGLVHEVGELGFVVDFDFCDPAAFVEWL